MRPQTGWRWYVPASDQIERSARDGEWFARAVWRCFVVNRWGKTRRRAQINALRGVICYGLLWPLNQRWIKQKRDIYPRWYDWLVN